MTAPSGDDSDDGHRPGVDAVVAAGDEAGALGGQEDDDAGDLLDPARRRSTMPGRSSFRNFSTASATEVPSCSARSVIIASVIAVWMNAGETAFTSTSRPP